MSLEKASIARCELIVCPEEKEVYSKFLQYVWQNEETGNKLTYPPIKSTFWAGINNSMSSLLGAHW